MKPNLFIAGGPKCGTTALASYLSTHPQIFVSRVKEPHYFSCDFPRLVQTPTIDQYLRLFRSATSLQSHIGEASVFYLFSAVAVDQIFQFNQEARVIAMVRSPVEMIPSYHSQLLYTNDECIPNILAAWEMCEERRSGRQIPRACREAKLLSYDRIAKFGEQLQRVYRTFPVDQVLVIFFDDFKQNPAATYSRVLEFLQVPHDGRTVFPILNANKRLRWRRLGLFTDRPPVRLTKMSERLKKKFGIREWKILRTLRKINHVQDSRPAVELELKRAIISEYRNDIDLLASITGRNLSHWSRFP